MFKLLLVLAENSSERAISLELLERVSMICQSKSKWRMTKDTSCAYILVIA